MLTIEDLAAKVQTSTRQIRNMISRGQCPPGTKRPGLGLRWTPAQVQRWIDTGEVSP